jgi:hypothetical protein
MADMSNPVLPGFTLEPDDYGWSGRFPGGPHLLFGIEIGLEINTRLVPDDPPVLPPISESQAALVRAITPALPDILTRVAAELIKHNQKFDPEFQRFLRHPAVWLSSEHDDGVSWTFVVERTDNPDFGYHAEFKGVEFVELWSGD